MLNTEKIRKDFPVLQKTINGKPVVYMDSACMTLKPVQVIEKINQYYREYPACGGRSLHKLGKWVTEQVEETRNTLRKFLNAKKPEEIVFTKNTTEGINLVANSLNLKGEDIVLGTDKEHNSNLLPWQSLVKRKGIRYETVKSNPDNTFNMENFERAMSGKVKLVSMVHLSNLDGVCIPAKEIIKTAHDYGALVLLDGAQSVPHIPVDVRKLDVDFLAFSGHKMLGPTGVGVLYGKYDLLENLDTFVVGGDTVMDTTYRTAKFEKPPAKFEAGLQHYSGIIGLSEAARYLEKLGMENIHKHEQELGRKIVEGMGQMERISIIGPKTPSGTISFNLDGTDSHEVAMMMDEIENICVRSGAHCVHSWFNSRGLRGSVRASLYLYNTQEECGKFLETLKRIIDIVK